MRHTAKKNTEGGKEDNNQMKKKNEVYRHKKRRDGLAVQNERGAEPMPDSPILQEEYK